MATPTDADVDAALSNVRGLPDRPKTTTLLKNIIASLNSGVASLAFSDVTGSPTDNTALAQVLNGKLSTTAQIPRTQVTGLGTASTYNVPAVFGAAAGATEVMRGDDPRGSDARAPTSHTHPQSQVTNLATDLATAKRTPLQYTDPAPAVGSYPIEEYALAAATSSRVIDRVSTGTVTWNITVAGVTVGLSNTGNSTTSQLVRTVTANGSTAVGARTTLNITAVSSPGVFSLLVDRSYT